MSCYPVRNAVRLCWILMKRRAIETRSLIILQGVLTPVTLATWSPIRSVAHLIEYTVSSFPVPWKIILFSKWLNPSLEWKFETVYLVQSEEQFLISFSRLLCPKHTEFKKKIVESLSVFGRTEVDLESKWFLSSLKTYFSIRTWVSKKAPRRIAVFSC